MLARMIQRDDSQAFFISSFDLRSLVSVASPASEAKVILFSSPACRERYYMFNLERHAQYGFLGLTIFTTMAGTLGHKITKLWGNIGHYWINTAGSDRSYPRD